MKKQPIPIFFTIDDGYAPYLAVALKSLVENSSSDECYRAIIVHRGLSDAKAQKLSAVGRDNFEIDFVPMAKGLDFLTDRMGTRLRCDYFTLTIYFRLFIASMFPDYDKAIYLDSDLVVLSDLGELYSTELGDNLVGAVVDHSVMDSPELVNYIERGVGVKAESYVNSGVLLMNLGKMRECGFEERVMHLLSDFNIETLAPDQDCLNAVCSGRIKYLDARWNTMPIASQDISPKIVHYNLYMKPWCYEETKMGEYFWEYAEKTPYYDLLRQGQREYSIEDREKDERCMRTLTERGAALPDARDSVTYAKLERGGVRIKL